MDVRHHETPDALTGVEMFAGLDAESRQRVIAAAVPRTYRKGQLLFVENDPSDSLIVLKRGAIAVFRTAPTGERAVLAVIRPPSFFGEVSLLDGGTRSTSAEAIEDTRALALSRHAFIELVHSNPAILDAVMQSLGNLIRRLTEQHADHIFLDLPGRVAKTLVRLAERLGVADGDDRAQPEPARGHGRRLAAEREPGHRIVRDARLAAHRGPADRAHRHLRVAPPRRHVRAVTSAPPPRLGQAAVAGVRSAATTTDAAGTAGAAFSVAA